MGDLLHSAYESTAEDLRYGIGLMVDTNRRSMPMIAVRYENWPPDKLEVVRQMFVDGLTVEHKSVNSDTVDVYVATHQKITVRSTSGGHTHVMHAPAWDARLAAVDDHQEEPVARAVKQNRLYFRIQFAPGNGRIKRQLLRQLLHNRVAANNHSLRSQSPRFDRTLPHGLCLVRDQQIFGKLARVTQPAALRTSAVRMIVGEVFG